ncbi:MULTISPECIES: TenA family protein [unclassified Rhizobium]|uniref:TenA family protein n=1 Tax=unclassified Rhizobium TaxID=2613769 RepID=UPI00381D048B
MTETLSEKILRENDAVLSDMLRHRFIADIKHDKLTKEGFERYLVYEAAFVDTAISIFAYAAATAPRIDQKRWLISVLDALANDQIAYFERTFSMRQIDVSQFDAKLPQVTAFCEGMLSIARKGGFLDVLAAMFAAEWMYWTWSKDAAGCDISDPLLKEWINMHVDQTFADQALWLKTQLDEAGEALGAEDRDRLSEIFGQAMRLEIDFHDAPYMGVRES